MDEKEKARLSLVIVNWLAPFSAKNVGFPLPAFENLIQANTPSPLTAEDKDEKAKACMDALSSRQLVKVGLFENTYVATSSKTFTPSVTGDPWAWGEA